MASSYSVVRHMHRDTLGRKNHRIDSIDATRHHRTTLLVPLLITLFLFPSNRYFSLFFSPFFFPSKTFISSNLRNSRARFLLYIFHVYRPHTSTRFLPSVFRDYIAVQITRARSSLLYTRVPFNGLGTIREARKAVFVLNYNVNVISKKTILFFFFLFCFFTGRISNVDIHPRFFPPNKKFDPEWLSTRLH